MIDRFHYLKVGLSLVLVLVWLKMLTSNVLIVPVGISLAAVAALIGGSILASLLRPVPEPVTRPPGIEPP